MNGQVNFCVVAPLWSPQQGGPMVMSVVNRQDMAGSTIALLNTSSYHLIANSVFKEGP